MYDLVRAFPYAFCYPVGVRGQENAFNSSEGVRGVELYADTPFMLL
jgi:hypothetical protein